MQSSTDEPPSVTDESVSDVRRARRLRRRQAVRTLGAGVACLGATAGLAGCLTGGVGDSGTTPISNWLSESDGETEVADRTGVAETTVDVGVDDGLSFGPPAIRVDRGTTVVWEWTGKGGRHNVVDREDTFASEYHEDEGSTFEQLFDTPRRAFYYCAPHRDVGMRGVVVVE